MAESNPTQVILTDDGLKIIKAQNTANEAVGNVNDINSDNKLTPSEKLKLKQEYDKDVELYNIDIEQLKSVDLPTTELEIAMSNLTDFVTPLFKEMNRTSTVDRDALDSVFTAFATADKNTSQTFVNMVQQVADDAKKAGDDAKEAGEKAQEAGVEAKASADQAKADATQAKADAATAQQKAQSSIDQFNAHLQDIDEALSTANLVKQNVTKLSDTTEQYHNEYTTGIQNIIKTIDGISIGGTNLIENSSSDVVIDDTVNNQGWAHSAIYSELEVGQQYTFSSEVTVNVGNANNICVNTYNPSDGSTTLISNRPIVNGKIEYTFTAVKDFPVLLVYAGTMGGTKGNKVTFHHYQLEKGNKATDWSPAPEDLATSTEFDQLSNAIKLKADSSDVTSQITVATQGIQSEVDNKVSDLNTKISQTDSAWRASVNTLGTTNMVYNGGFAHGVDGWDTQNGKWGWSNQAQDQVQGSNAIQARFTGLTTDTWSNATSKAFLVRSGQKMSIGAIVTPWVLDSDPNKGFGIGLNFYASTDGTGVRNNSYHPEQWIYTTGRQQLKVENITVPDGANSAVVKLYIQRNGGANFTRVQANMTPTLPQFIDGFATATDITASINDINLKVSNSDGSSSQVNINNDTILLDANKIIFNGNTSIQNGTIGTAKIANAAINTAQIADGAINNAKIANAAINDAKISNLNGNKIIARSIAASKINVDDLIANGINTKTLTSVNLNTSTLTTPELDLGLNGTFTEDFDYTQNTSFFLPKKNTGTLTFNHGVLQSKGTMQTYTGGQWGGMNDNIAFQAGISNVQWTELAPGYIKMDLCKQDGSVGQRIYADPTGFYYTSATGNNSYLGNILQTGQVQSGSILGKYIGPMDGQLRLQIGNNGNDYGLQVGSYGGGEGVLSDFIYNSTNSGSANIHITENGRLTRSTSASKYKYNIKNPDIETTLGDRLLNVHLATWNDKRAVDSYAEQLSTGEEREKSSIDEYYGLIAEQLRDAGLDMFISYGKNHEIEGIQYDRAWIPLLSVIRRLNNKVNEYELRLSKLEGKINE
ncbi:hypothetical protein [uncultured Pediococcus sp.]|uniref:hypothetical protein n=1 Tax=uncultured Pediococcus sp. TaxID=165192 RepID=UPI00259B03E9|nr:hypothetical protein [uncultured Pediococcus sp.]